MAHDSKLFTTLAEKKTIIVEESTLEANAGGAVYHGNRIRFLDLRSSRTGRIATFREHHLVRDAEGELQATVFHPTSESLRLHPQLRGWELHILND